MASNLRIGHGYDVHRLVEGRRCIIGGVDIPHSKGLLGHSDADVLAHALADAIYGLIKYPALSGMFASKGLEEVTNLKWNDAAAKIKSVYEAVIEENKKQLK